MDPWPVKTRLRQEVRNAASLLPTYCFKKASLTPSPFSVTGFTLDPSCKLDLSPVNTSRSSSVDTSDALTLLLAITATAWAFATEQLRTVPKNRIDRHRLFIALSPIRIGGDLEAEANLRRQHVRLRLQTGWVCIRVIIQRGSIDEMTLQLGVEIGVKVIPAGYHPVV